VSGEEHAFGISPAHHEFNWTGLPFTREQFDSVAGTDKAAWQDELKLHEALFEQLAHGLPKQMLEVKKRIEARLAA
jgi:phosphoenolpyruvate carboxykinase (GTP)